MFARNKELDEYLIYMVLTLPRCLQSILKHPTYVVTDSWEMLLILPNGNELNYPLHISTFEAVLVSAVVIPYSIQCVITSS